MCRRGYLSLMTSDNGTNLVSADTELRAAMQQWNQDTMQEALAQKGIQWMCNPPAGPHFGAGWERQVKLGLKVCPS